MSGAPSQAESSREKAGSFRKYVHMIGHLDVLKMLCLFSIAFYVLTRNVSMDVRVGMFGTCFRFPIVVAGQAVWNCSSDAKILQRHNATSNDPLQLLAAADGFSRRVVFYGLVLGAIALEIVTIAALSRFPGWRSEVDDDGEEVEVKPIPSRVLTGLSLGSQTMAVLFGGISILWIHVGAVAYTDALDQLFHGYVKTSIGATVMISGWLGTALSAVVVFALLNFINTIEILERLLEMD